MDKKRAVQLLETQLKGLEPLEYAEVNPDFDRWRRDTRVVLENIFGEGTRQVKEFEDIRFWSGVIGASQSENMERDRQAFARDKTLAAAFLESVISEVDQFGDESEKSPPQDLDPLCGIRKLCERFHFVARQLRVRHEDRETLEVEDEYDVQDLLHALLRLESDDIRPEEWTPSYAGKSARMDFLLKRDSIVIETKKTRKGLGEKDVGDELLVDIARYKGHPDCKTLVCFVYDPEARIGNPVGLENDLSGERDGLAVIAIVRPQ